MSAKCTLRLIYQALSSMDLNKIINSPEEQKLMLPHLLTKDFFCNDKTPQGSVEIGFHWGLKHMLFDWRSHLPVCPSSWGGHETRQGLRKQEFFPAISSFLREVHRERLVQIELRRKGQNGKEGEIGDKRQKERKGGGKGTGEGSVQLDRGTSWGLILGIKQSAEFKRLLSTETK